MKLTAIWLAGAAALALAGSGGAARAATCPSFGDDTDCGIIITFNPNGSVTTTATGQPPYDGVEDTLVGVVNNSTKSIASIPLTSTSDIFGFDGDGIDTYGAPSNTKDTSGYGGPNAFYSGINGTLTSGTVNFITPIAPGTTGFFSLEGPPSVNIVVGTPEPATMALLGAGLVGLGIIRRRRRD